MTHESLIKRDKILINLLIGTAFLCGVFPPEISCALELFFYIFLSKKIVINRKAYPVFVFLVAQGIIGIILRFNTITLFGKQIIGITISFLCFFSLVNEKNFLYVIKIIKGWTLFAAIVSIIQRLSFEMGIHPLYDWSWIVNNNINVDLNYYQSFSIFTEPSEAALMLLFFTSLSLYRLLGKNRKLISEYISVKESVIIIIGFVLTLSSSGFLGLAVPLLFILFEYGLSLRNLLIFIGAIIVAVFAYMRVSGFYTRVNDTFNILVGRNTNFDMLNTSTATLFVNIQVALKAFIHTWGFGGGLGSHKIFYEMFAPKGIYVYGFNAEDGNSLVIRLLSEAGIIGIVAVFCFITKNRSKSKSIYSLISMACLSVFLVRLIRSGHYFNDALWLYVGLYYACHKMEKVETVINHNKNEYVKNISYNHIIQ